MQNPLEDTPAGVQGSVPVSKAEDASIIERVRLIVETLRMTDPELFTLPDVQQLALVSERVVASLEDGRDTPLSEERFALWRRLAGQARLALQFAYEEAERTGSTAVSPEHLTLGIFYNDDTAAAHILTHIGKSVHEIRSELQRQVAWEDFRTGQDIPLSNTTKQVIDWAYKEAQQLNDEFLGTEHLLIGLMREGTTLASHVLSLFEVTAEEARTALLQIREESSEQLPEVSGAASLPTPRRISPSLLESRYGDLGIARSTLNRSYIEVTLDGPTFIELVAIYRAHDAHGYRALVHGHQTTFLIPTGTPLKRLVPPSETDAATTAGGYYVRVLEGEYQGYGGWIFSANFERTGPDEAPFPPELE